jgi:hypothetical protein
LKIYASQAHVAEKINESSEALKQLINETSESLSSEVSELKTSGGVGHIETKKYTFDGDLTEKTVIDMGDAGQFVKVSDEVIKATEFKYLTMFD